MGLCLYMGMCILVQVSLEDRGFRYFWSCSSRKLQAPWCGYWELCPWPLGEEYVLNHWAIFPSPVYVSCWVHNTNRTYLENFMYLIGMREKKADKRGEEGKWQKKIKGREEKGSREGKGERKDNKFWKSKLTPIWRWFESLSVSMLWSYHKT